MRLFTETLSKRHDHKHDNTTTANARKQTLNDIVDDIYHPHGIHQHVLAPHSLDAHNTTPPKYAFAATLITGSQTQNLTAQHATRGAAN